MRASLGWRRGGELGAHQAVLGKIADYSVGKAVAGTLRALDAVVRPDRRARPGASEARRA
jgi:hypothetical protein